MRQEPRLPPLWRCHLALQDFRLPLRIGLLTGTYLLAGKLALLLAIPPGFATAVWPAAGIALAACLAWGNRVWPGVFLGSLLVNVTTGFDPSSTAALLHSLTPPTIIAAGASLQALCGAFLVRRFVGFPLSLNRLPRISLLLFIGGPCSCLIGATVGVGALQLAGRIGEGQLLANWGTWWLGDSLGVVVFLPLAAAWGMELQRSQMRTRLSVILPLVLALVLTVGLFLHVRRAELTNRQLTFSGQAENLAQAIATNIDVYRDVLFSIEGLFHSSKEVDREEFRKFVSYSFARHQGIQALEWVPRVPAQERDRLEASARADGFAGFVFTERNQQGHLVPAAPRPEYFPVFYLEPYASNEAAFGFDLGFSVARKEALYLARDTGRPVATQRVTLLQQRDSQFGILLFVPIYISLTPPATLDERQTRFLGAVCGVFQIPELVEAALRPLQHQGFVIEIHDLSATKDQQFIYSSQLDPPSDPPSRDLPDLALRPDDLGYQKLLDVGSRRWLLRLFPTPDYLAARQPWGAWAVLTGGLIFCCLLGSFLLLVVGRKVMTERVVELRTAELQESNLQLEQEVAERERAEAELQETQAELERRVTKRTEELAKANEDLTAVNHLIMTCSSLLDMSEILERVMDQALEITGLEGGTICFTQADQALHLAAHRETSEATIADLTNNVIKIGDCLCGRSALEQKPLILRDRQQVLSFSSREATRNEEIQFHAAFPLVTAGRCVGVLCLFTKTAHIPSERSLKLIETVSSPIALAIDNANLYEQKVRYASTLEEKVQERTTELQTAQHRLQQLVDELNAANLRLQDLDRAKSMFIASMSHELRTPLNSIIGFSNILLKEMPGPLNFEQKKQLKMVTGSARHLLNLINDILDISKIESGELTLVIAPVRLSEVLQQVRESLAPLAESKGLSLRVSLPPEVDSINSDSRRLRQILLNLVGNALKFTESGGVQILCGLNRGRLAIQVVDSGIGIREQDMDQLFHSFRQIDTGLSRKYEGTGLGLFISQRLAQMLGGDIRVTSRFGQGTTFTLTLPLGKEATHG